MPLPCLDPPGLNRRARAGLAAPATTFLLAGCGGSDDGLIQRIAVNVMGEGTGSGTVVATDAAVDIDCTITDGDGGAGCSTAFDDNGGGGIFNLVATPSAGSAFGGWEGCSSVSSTTCTLTFLSTDGNRTFDVVATFTADIPSSCTVGTTISDQFATGAGWTVTTVVNSGSPTQAATFQATGGNPGGFRRMEHIFPGAGEMFVYHYYTTTSYNPSMQGAIDHINYFEDQIVIDPPSVGDQIGTGFTMTQGGASASVIMRPPGAFFTNTTWESTSRLDLTAANFPTIDFSATGGPITFGYYRANTKLGAGAVTLTHGIDNWRVDICRE